MKIIHSIKLYLISILIDSVLMVVMLWFILSNLRNPYRNEILFLLLFIPLAISIVSFVIQWKVSKMEELLTISDTQHILNLRYAFIIPYGVIMVLIAFVTRTYLVFSIMMLGIFIVFSFRSKADDSWKYDSSRFWPHVVRTLLILLVSFFASILSMFGM